jgi:RHS repeat-associated protein
MVQQFIPGTCSLDGRIQLRTRHASGGLKRNEPPKGDRYVHQGARSERERAATGKAGEGARVRPANCPQRASMTRTTGGGDEDDVLMVQTTPPGTPPVTLHTSGIGNSYYFTGRRLHLYEDLSLPGINPNKQLQFNRARHYTPDDGRRMQRDPAEYFDAMNLYQYVHSRPIRNVDPSGLRTFARYGNWIADGPVTWASAGRAFFFYETSVSLPTTGWLGVILETAAEIYPAGAYAFVTDNYSFVSRWPPGALNGVSCYCPWKRQQPCKRCVTRATQSGWGPFGGDNPITTSQTWERKVHTKGSAVTRSTMWTRGGDYDYLCSCDPPAITTPICPSQPKARCSCSSNTPAQ